MARKKPGKNSPILFIIICAVVLLALVGLVTVNILSLNRLGKANDFLTAENEELKEKAKEVQAEYDAYRYDQETDTSYDYLAVGNSITRHPVYENYWWGEWGMAASSEEMDYFHRVKEKISQLYTENSAQALNFTTWEKPFYDRKNALPYLEGYLSEDLDLVTVQLGENITRPEEMSDEEYRLRMEADFKDLLTCIKENAPDAKIIIVGNFWEDRIMDEVKQSLAQEFGAAYISLSDVNGPEYRIGVGGQVLGADGVTHTIETEGVGEHPNDEAMRYIADRITENIPGMGLGE